MGLLLPLLSVLCAYVSLTLATERNIDASYGLAFSLSMDYGVASAYFPNGTYVNIAKIEGGPKYKDYLRNIDPVGRQYSSIPEDLQTAESFLDGVLHRLWPKKRPMNNPFTAVFKALKTASEATLERPVSIVEIAVNSYPYGPLTSGFGAKIDAALEENSLRKLRPAPINGEMAGRAKGIERYCGGEEPPDHTDPERVVLSVENTRSGLTIHMWTEDSCIYHCYRILQSSELGQDSLDDCERTNSSQMCVDKFDKAIRNITRMPLEFSRGGKLERISEIVLLGEGAADARLNAVLRAILQEQYSAESVDALLALTPTDPAFLASRLLAEMDWSIKSHGNEIASAHDEVKLELR